MLADGDLHFEVAAGRTDQLDRDGGGVGQQAGLLGEDAQGALWLELLGEGGAGGLQAGDFGESVAHLAVQPRVFDRDGDVVREELQYFAVLGVEHPRRRRRPSRAKTPTSCPCHQTGTATADSTWAATAKGFGTSRE